jgi:hypothetical protein
MPLPRRARRRPRIEVASTVCDAMEWKFRNGRALQREKSDPGAATSSQSLPKTSGETFVVVVSPIFWAIRDHSPSSSVDCAHARIA